MFNEGGYTVAELREDRLKVAQLRDIGFTAMQLAYNGGLSGGYSMQEINDGGFTADSLKAEGFTASKIREGNYTVHQIKDAGFTAKQLKAESFEARLLLQAGFDLRQLVADGRSRHQGGSNGACRVSERRGGGRASAACLAEHVLDAAHREDSSALFFAARMLSLVPILSSSRTHRLLSDALLQAHHHLSHCIFAASPTSSSGRLASRQANSRRKNSVPTTFLKADLLHGARAQGARELGDQPRFCRVSAAHICRVPNALACAHTLPRCTRSLTHKQLREASFTASELKAESFSAKDLFEGGFSVKDAFDAGYPG
eukprot:7390638-Prymnesium_polylepis.2